MFSTSRSARSSPLRERKRTPFNAAVFFHPLVCRVMSVKKSSALKKSHDNDGTHVNDHPRDRRRHNALSLEARHRIRARSRRAEMSALASARAERAPLCDRPAPAGTLDLSLGVFGFARDSRVVSLKALGVPVACSHDLGASHHDRRHFIDKDFLLSLPDGARLLEAARATKPSPACRAVICLADADVYEFGTDFASGARSVASGATHLRVLGMLPVPLPVTLRVRPGTLAGSPRSDALGEKKLTARLSDALVVERLPVPAHVSLRRATECASARGRDDVVADLVLAVCDPRAPRTKPGAFPERYRARPGWEGTHRQEVTSPLPAPRDGGGDEKDSEDSETRSDVRRENVSRMTRTGTHTSTRTANTNAFDDRASVARLWFANHQARAQRAAAVYAAEDRFAAERARLSRAPDDARAVACARCGAREGKPPARALRRCAGCVSRAPPNVDGNVAHYCSKACQARHWGRHRDVCPAGLAGRARRRETARGDAPLVAGDGANLFLPLASA